MEPREVLLNAGTDPGEVSAALNARYRVLVGTAATGRSICLDTADWRLHNAGLALTDARFGRRSTLVLSGGGGAELTVPAPARRWPRRVETLPASPVRDRIAAPVGVRALLPLAEIGVRSLSVQVLDDEDKTRVRMRIDQQRLLGARLAPLPLRVRITPVRGYERDALRCAALLGEAMAPLADVGSNTAAALTAAGHVPGQAAAPVPELDPDAPAAESLARVLRRWIDTIDAVRPGVLADLDPEFLHDLRTSVRGTRSLLRVSRDIVPEAQVDRFAGEFAWLGRLTAPLRDLDVTLQELAGAGAVDLRGLPNLDAVQRRLATQRRRALTSLRTAMQSPRGEELSTQWRAALTTLSAPDVTGATTSATTSAAAAAQARASYQHIVKAAASITDQTHPDELHRLRRRCKRMRYLLDAYASVYPAKPQRQVSSALKALQVCLGDIQDVHVQRRQLSDIAVALDQRGADTATLLAIGALLDRMHQRETAARLTLARRLARFCAPVTKARVRALGPVDA